MPPPPPQHTARGVEYLLQRLQLSCVVLAFLLEEVPHCVTILCHICTALSAITAHLRPVSALHNATLHRIPRCHKRVCNRLCLVRGSGWWYVCACHYVMLTMCVARGSGSRLEECCVKCVYRVSMEGGRRLVGLLWVSARFLRSQLGRRMELLRWGRGRVSAGSREDHQDSRAITENTNSALTDSTIK